jgi:NTE family protein
MPNPFRSRPTPISLALQGGGAHGAFTWGVLDRLLEDGRFPIAAISGTSAGAMNAVVLAHGLLERGPDGARAALQRFWHAVGSSAPLDAFLVGSSEQPAFAPAARAWMHWARLLSPYQLNPLGLNPLRDVLSQQIDFERLRTPAAPRLFIAATHANSGRLRLFDNADVTADTLLASACLPTLQSAVEIDGEPYWDGGYTGNPALGPLLRSLPKQKFDMIFVRIDPINHGDTPHTVREINDRITEIIFNSTLMLELGMLAVILQFVDEGLLDRERFGRVLFHVVEASDIMEKLNVSSKLNNAPILLEYLFDLGRKTADVWWADHGAAIGQRSTVDLQKLLPEEYWSRT